MEEKQGGAAKHIVITGPESTGKTELAIGLSEKYKVKWVPEFARHFIEQLNRPYEYADVVTIAKKQLEQIKNIQDKPFVIFDTGLIITKVWFAVVYKKYPEWLIHEININRPQLCLLCDTDLPWVPDEVRENGGVMREKLFRMYEEELQFFNIPYEIISGTGPVRFNNACDALQKHNIVAY